MIYHTVLAPLSLLLLVFLSLDRGPWSDLYLFLLTDFIAPNHKYVKYKAKPLVADWMLWAHLRLQVEKLTSVEVVYAWQLHVMLVSASAV